VDRLFSKAGLFTSKKKEKPKDSPEVKVHKLEIEKLELEKKLKKAQSEKTALTVTVVLFLMFGGMVFLSIL
jgi:hypothetical protein